MLSTAEHGATIPRSLAQRYPRRTRALGTRCSSASPFDQARKHTPSLDSCTGGSIIPCPHAKLRNMILSHCPLFELTVWSHVPPRRSLSATPHRGLRLAGPFFGEGPHSWTSSGVSEGAFGTRSALRLLHPKAHQLLCAPRIEGLSTSYEAAGHDRREASWQASRN